MIEQNFSIYDILDEIRPRPAMYMGVKSILYLSSFLQGYHFAEVRNGIVDRSKPDFGGFDDWVARKFGRHHSAEGWAGIILAELEGNESQSVDRFYELLDEFRAHHA